MRGFYEEAMNTSFLKDETLLKIMNDCGIENGDIDAMRKAIASYEFISKQNQGEIFRAGITPAWTVKDFKRLSVEILNISDILISRLDRSGIKTVGDLISCSQKRLHLCRGLGPKYLNEALSIRERLMELERTLPKSVRQIKAELVAQRDENSMPARNAKTELTTLVAHCTPDEAAKILPQVQKLLGQMRTR